MEIKIINHSKNRLPAYETVGSAGMDVKANLDDPVFLAPMERSLIPSGLFLEIPQGFEIQIRPRSGLAIKKGLTLLNSPGTIDSDYRGEIKVIMVNLSNETVQVSSGDRIAQMVLARVEQAQWNQVDKIEETTRGIGGFGHTGNN